MENEQSSIMESYQSAKPGFFGRAEWLDLLMCCQDGKVSCMRALEIIEREIELSQNSSKHIYWGVGEEECPIDIKAANGELHTLKCKLCGLENPKDNRCNKMQQSESGAIIGSAIGVDWN